MVGNQIHISGGHLPASTDASEATAAAGGTPIFAANINEKRNVARFGDDSRNHWMPVQGMNQS